MTRQELYALVWSTPVAKLCERFSISDRGLAKLCERHEIPVPERGWWAKHAAGHAVDRAPLPKAKNEYMEHVELYVREDWRHYVTAEERSWFEQRLAEEGSIPPPEVSPDDDSRHPLIVQARRQRKEGEPARMQFAMDVSKDLRHRALRLAAALVETCEQRGYAFALRPGTETGAAGVVIGGQNIGLSIEEPFAKVPHLLTKAEAREKALGRGWSIPEFDSVRSGELVLVLDHSVNGERRSFGEKPDRPLERNFPEVFKSLLRIALRMRAEENYREEQERRQREAAEQRAEGERHRREDAARIAEQRRQRRELLRAATRWRQAREILALAETVQRASSERGVSHEALRDWLAHARRVAQDLDPTESILREVDERAPVVKPRNGES